MSPPRDPSLAAANDANVAASSSDPFHLLVHDLRNPLSGVIGFLELLCTPGVPSNASFAEAALEGARRMRALLEDVLTVRSLAEGELRVHGRPTDLATVCQDAAASLRGAARQAGVAIGAPSAGTGPTVDADASLVRRAVENLIANAIRYSAPGGAVVVEVGATASAAHIAVLDRGPGVPDALKDAIFGKFTSVERAKGLPARGFGLGLHLVALVARAHGGGVHVRDREGGGSVFGLELPLGC